MNQIVIGIVGRMRAGKGTFARAFRNVANKDGWYPSIGSVSFSKCLRTVLDYFEILPSVENHQQLADWLNARKQGAVAIGTRKKVQEAGYEVSLVDGVRWPWDVPMLKEFPRCTIVGIVVDPNDKENDLKIRWQRCVAAKERPGDDVITLEGFKERDSRPTEIHIDGIVAQADLVFVNNGGEEDLEKQVKEKLYLPIIKPLRTSSKELPS